MALKTFKVQFARTAVGRSAKPLAVYLADIVNNHGSNIPAVLLARERFQVRELTKVGFVWKGTFVKLRDDAPNIVKADDAEHELNLDVGDRVIEKCHFLYRTNSNILVWQSNRSAGTLTRAESYLGHILGEVVAFNRVMNTDELEQKLMGDVYELDFAYDRPITVQDAPPNWNRNAFDLMAEVQAAHAKFVLRAPRGGNLDSKAKSLVRRLVKARGAEKIRIKMTDDMELIDVLMAPLHDTISVEMQGRYPQASHVFEALEEAFDRQERLIAESDEEL